MLCYAIRILESFFLVRMPIDAFLFRSLKPCTYLRGFGRGRRRRCRYLYFSTFSVDGRDRSSTILRIEPSHTGLPSSIFCDSVPQNVKSRCSVTSAMILIMSVSSYGSPAGIGVKNFYFRCGSTIDNSFFELTTNGLPAAVSEATSA